ncbi:hypothetical protein [Ureibacillus sp. GCM10028918]|uniref:hypothetical protein n=1 Tax=Ureibacillus sp. GCM10028918 TaxID=3273429 RepID=UPI003620AC03
MNMKDTTEQPINFSKVGNPDNLLINEPTLELYPTLAVAIGINEAIVLAKLDRLLQTSAISMEGHNWCKQSYQHWHAHFPFWSTKTIERTIKKLEKNGYIISRTKFNNTLNDKIKWYRIDYGKTEQLI